MKTKNMKKALSFFLAVLMIALALPFTLLSVSAEESAPVATTIANVTSTSDGRTVSGTTYTLEWAWDNDLTTTYLGMNVSSKRYGVVDGVFGSGTTYQDYITVELSALSNLKSVTIWAGYDKASKSFTNHDFDVYYSQDGETWTLHSSYASVCGDDSVAGNSSAFTEEAKATDEDGEHTYYGVKLDINDIAKYVRIAVGTGRIDRGWSVLRDIAVEGTDVVIPVSVAGIQQGADGVRLVGVTNSTAVAGVGFKLNATHTYEEAAESVPASISSATMTLKKGNRNDNIPIAYGSVEGMFDGDEDRTYGVGNDNSDYPYFYSKGTLSYNRSFYYDEATGRIERNTDGNDYSYHGYAVFSLAALSELNSATVWLASDGGNNGGEWSDPTQTWTINDAYDILISTDGETWKLMGEFDNMCGDGTNKGANFPEKGDADYDERTLGRYLRVGHKIDLDGETAAYVAIAIKEASNNAQKYVMIGELTVDGTVVADTITVTKTASVTTDATNVVYNSILANGKNVTAKDIDADLYGDNDKLYALGITGVPTNGTVTLEVTPYFVPTGTELKVYGNTATFEFVDGKALNVQETVKVMSYNINNGQVNDKVLSRRLDYIAAQINSVDPDVVILNEAHNYETHSVSYDMKTTDLVAKCDVNYGIVEYTNEESKNVILYNTEKYTLVSSEIITLTNLDQDGNEGDQYERTAVFARLKRISDGREFVATAVHLDMNKGVAKMQAWQINDKLAESYDDVRQIVGGDFNFTSPIHDAQNGASTVHTNPFVNEGYTDVNVNVDSTETKDGSGVIDFIYSKGFEAEGYTVVKAAGASNASDHYAIYAELTLN